MNPDEPAFDDLYIRTIARGCYTLADGPVADRFATFLPAFPFPYNRPIHPCYA